MAVEFYEALADPTSSVDNEKGPSSMTGAGRRVGSSLVRFGRLHWEP